MNQQREVIYKIRDRILEGEDMSGTARAQIRDVIAGLVDQYLVGDYVEDWDIDGLFTQLEQIYPTALAAEDIDPNSVDRESLKVELEDDAIKAYDEREEELGEELMRQIERFILLQIIDDRWREHLHDMDYLREGIHLRGFAQIDPLVAYKNEGFEMFGALVAAIWEEFARYIYHVEVEYEGANGFQQAQGGPRALQYGGGGDQPSALAAAAAAGTAAGLEYAEEEMLDMPVQVETRHVDEKEQIGRNDPCWCGSGKKFKKCHGA
jgi:preprotein translocase subunit SecA